MIRFTVLVCFIAATARTNTLPQIQTVNDQNEVDLGIQYSTEELAGKKPPDPYIFKVDSSWSLKLSGYREPYMSSQLVRDTWADMMISQMRYVSRVSPHVSCFKLMGDNSGQATATRLIPGTLSTKTAGSSKLTSTLRSD